MQPSLRVTPSLSLPQQPVPSATVTQNGRKIAILDVQQWVKYFQPQFSIAEQNMAASGRKANICGLIGVICTVLAIVAIVAAIVFIHLPVISWALAAGSIFLSASAMVCLKFAENFQNQQMEDQIKFFNLHARLQANIAIIKSEDFKKFLHEHQPAAISQQLSYPEIKGIMQNYRVHQLLLP
jgi:hypothetical protein